VNPGEGLIRRARKARGLTLDQLAGRAGIHPHTLAAAEIRPWSTVRQLARFADLLGYDLAITLHDRSGAGHDIT